MNKFLYQAVYIKESIDCIISVVSSNESTLNNLTDSIRINEKRNVQLILMRLVESYQTSMMIQTLTKKFR